MYQYTHEAQARAVGPILKDREPLLIVALPAQTATSSAGVVADTPDKTVVVESEPRAYAGRGTATDDSAAFAVQDGNYLSARWPRDAYLFAKRLIALLRAC